MPLNLLPTRTVLHDRSYGLESRHLRVHDSLSRGISLAGRSSSAYFRCIPGTSAETFRKVHFHGPARNLNLETPRREVTQLVIIALPNRFTEDEEQGKGVRRSC
jgi:hypothetical protein